MEQRSGWETFTLGFWTDLTMSTCVCIISQHENISDRTHNTELNKVSENQASHILTYYTGDICPALTPKIWVFKTNTAIMHILKCVYFCIGGIIILSLLSLMQYKFQAKLNLWAHREKPANRVKLTINVRISCQWSEAWSILGYLANTAMHSGMPCKHRILPEFNPHDRKEFLFPA